MSMRGKYESLLEELNAVRRQLSRIEQSIHTAMETPEPAPAPTPTEPEQDQPIPEMPEQQRRAMFDNEGARRAAALSMGKKFTSRDAADEDEASTASRVLGFVGVICFVLAAGFLVKLAIDSGWLTPPRQLGLAALFGVTLIGIGDRLMQKDAQYGSLLPGAGVVILYLVAYSGRLYYNLYDTTVALLFVSGLGVFTIALSARFKQEFFAAVAVIGTYLFPFLLNLTARNQTDVMVFFLLWDVAFVVSSVLISSRAMLLVASYLALGMFFMMMAPDTMSPGSAELSAVVFFQLIQFFIFIAGIAFYSIYRKSPLQKSEAWAYFPALLFFYLIEYWLVNRMWPDYAPWLALAFAGAIYGIYSVARASLDKVTLASGTVVINFVAAVLLHAGYFELMPHFLQPWFAIALLAALPALNKKLELNDNHIVVGLAIAVVLITNYWRAMVGSGTELNTLGWIAINAAFAGIFIFYHLQSRDEQSWGSESAGWILAFANLQAVIGLYRIAGKIAAAMDMASLQKFIVSALWGVFAIGILLLSQARKDRRLAQSSLLVFALAAGKVLIYDVSSASAVVRILCLLTLGAALYGGGYIYRKIERW